MPEEKAPQNVAQPRRKLGKYELVERFERGGMATVYKAYDPTLDRYVAIKQIAAHLADNPQFVERFRHEAQVLAKLGDEAQNVVHIHELVEEADGLYIVMEYVEGRTLESYLPTAPLSPAVALKLLGQMARGLRAVHNQGIIHRDIKPLNIIVTPTGRVKITDFGLAGRFGGATSMAMGTTKYMAPELFKGGPVDGRADLYALGFIMYELLCPVDRFNDLFEDVLHDERSEALRWMSWHGDAERTVPPLVEVNPAVPKRLSSIVERLMAKDLNQRFASADELLAELKARFGRGSAGTAAISGDLAVKQVAGAAGQAESVLLMPEDDQAAKAEPGQKHKRLWGRKPAVAAGRPLKAGDTAPLPRKRSLLKTGLIAAAALLFLIVGISVASSLIHAKTRRLIRDSWVNVEAAREAYNTNEWKKAADLYGLVFPVLDRLRAPTEQESEKIKEARWMRDMAEATVARDKHDWKGAEEWLDRADKDGVERRIIIKFRQEMDNLKKFDDYKHTIADFIAKGLFDDALKTIKTAGDEFPNWAGDLDGLRIEAQFKKAMKEGQDLLDQGKYEEARKKFEEAQRLQDSDDVRKILENLKAKEGFYREVQAGRDAMQKGNYDEAITHFEAALKIQPDDKSIKDLIVECRYQKEFKAGQDAETRKAWTDAIAAYERALKIKQSAEVPQRIAACKAELELEDLTKQAQAAEAADDLEKAIELYNKIKAIRPSLELDAKILDLQYRLWMKRGREAERVKNWAEATRCYTEAKRLKDTPEVNEALKHVQNSQQYENLMTLGWQLFGDKLYLQARDTFKKAQKIMDTPEVQAAIHASDYETYMDLGRKAESAEDYGGALAQYKAAKRDKSAMIAPTTTKGSTMTTDDVDKAIERVQAKVH